MMATHLFLWFLCHMLPSIRAVWFGPSPYTKNCYYTAGGRKNWADAQAKCASMGLNLPSFDSNQEHYWAMNAGKGPAGVNSGLGFWGGGIWVYQNDRAVEGRFVDYAGRIGFRGGIIWGFDNYYNQDCASAVDFLGYNINDIDCGTAHSWICENLKPTCKKPYIAHGTSSEPADATNPDAFFAGESATINCDDGYTLEGDATLTCDCPGYWVASIYPKCVRNLCPAIAVTNMEPYLPVEKKRYSPGESLVAACVIGYVLTTQPLLMCSVDRWDGPVPGCRRPECTAVAVTNAAMSKASNYGLPGDTLGARCSNDDDLVIGRQQLTCEKNEGWDFPVSGCQHVTCMQHSPAQLENGALVYSQDQEISSVATPSCSAGYILEKGFKNSSATCEVDGIWDRPFKRCIDARGGCDMVIFKGCWSYGAVFTFAGLLATSFLLVITLAVCLLVSAKQSSGGQRRQTPQRATAVPPQGPPSGDGQGHEITEEEPLDGDGTDEDFAEEEEDMDENENEDGSVDGEIGSEMANEDAV